MTIMCNENSLFVLPPVTMYLYHITLWKYRSRFSHDLVGGVDDAPQLHAVTSPFQTVNSKTG
jgi:hypothetical protein